MKFTDDWAAAADSVMTNRTQFSAEPLTMPEKQEPGDRETGTPGESPIITFSNLPETRSRLIDALQVLLESLDYEQMHQEAQYWVHQVDIQAFREQTTNIEIADQLRDELISRFQFDINEVIASEAPTSRGGNPQVRSMIEVVAVCRIDTTFGASIQPTIRLTSPNRTDPMASEQTRSAALVSWPTLAFEKDDVPPAVQITKAEKGKRRLMPDQVEQELEAIFAEAIDISMASGNKVPIALVRDKLDQVQEHFPHLEARSGIVTKRRISETEKPGTSAVRTRISPGGRRDTWKQLPQQTLTLPLMSYLQYSLCQILVL